MVIRATERDGDELNERAPESALGARRRGRRGVKAGIVALEYRDRNSDGWFQ